jgi:protease secretion system membrane fusion protein
VLAHEGQLVQAEQPLLRLGDSTLRADWQQVRQQYFGLRAAEGRLMAEQLGDTRITFSRDLLEAAAEDPEIARHVAVQRELIASRRAAISSAVGSIRESIRGLEAQIDSAQQQISDREQQRSILKEQLSGIRDLVKEGYAPRNQALDLERALAENSVAIADLHGRLTSARQTILDLRQRSLNQESEFRKGVDTELANVRRDVGGLAERFHSLTQQLDKTLIRAPSAGQVVGLTVQTVGAVIGAGQKIMDIVPEDESLVLESKIPPHLIDRVASGDAVDVRFTAFAHAPQLVVQGKIVSISQDVLTEPQPMPGQLPSYYLARVSITPEGMAKMGSRKMQPGMQAEVVIRTGERTMLTYLLHPLIKRVAASMKEE